MIAASSRNTIAQASGLHGDRAERAVGGAEPARQPQAQLHEERLPLLGAEQLLQRPQGVGDLPGEQL
ncbi:hypothetical protein [Streptomyces sp. NPDC051636]|uniref:hypothetical protein n=1 Tax=Streptomyces sp. NPDC051636 TaxID=3365663 RepID=UPI003795CB29